MGSFTFTDILYTDTKLSVEMAQWSSKFNQKNPRSKIKLGAGKDIYSKSSPVSSNASERDYQVALLTIKIDTPWKAKITSEKCLQF